MERSASNEYSELRDFALALAEFLDRLRTDDGESYEKCLGEGFATNEAHVSRSRQLRGARVAVGDLLEATKDMKADLLRKADGWLEMKGVATLSAMQAYLATDSENSGARENTRQAEYYLLVERSE